MSNISPIRPFASMSEEDVLAFTEATGLDPHNREPWGPEDYARATAWLRQEAKARQMEAIGLAFEATEPPEE